MGPNFKVDFVEIRTGGPVNSAWDPHKNAGRSLQNHFNSIQTHTRPKHKKERQNSKRATIAHGMTNKV